MNSYCFKSRSHWQCFYFLTECYLIVHECETFKPCLSQICLENTLRFIISLSLIKANITVCALDDDKSICILLILLGPVCLKFPLEIFLNLYFWCNCSTEGLCVNWYFGASSTDCHTAIQYGCLAVMKSSAVVPA